MADYSKQWREYRRLRNRALAVAGLILVAPVVGVTFVNFAARSTAWLAVFIILGEVLSSTAIVTALRARTLEMPLRREKKFVLKWSSGLAIFFVERCANCGLAKFARN